MIGHRGKEMEELLARTNHAIRPAEVRDVLVRELLVQ